MKTLSIIVINLLVLGVLSCGSSNAGTANAGTDNASSSSTLKANFSCVLNGSAISGNGVDELQMRNTAFVYPDTENGNHVLFFLYTTKDGSDTKPAYSFRIKCPDKTGSYNFRGEDEFDAKTMPSVTLDYLTGDMSRYWIGNKGDVVTVTISSIDASHITGTFHAAMSLSNDTPNGAVKKVTIGDGKFDIPFSNSKLRPE